MMKKSIVLITLLFSVFLLFGNDKRFYDENGVILNSLYVDSPEGLRIRKEASLSSEKIGVLFDRQVVKVISIGKEITIDGITSNWVKILLPVESFNNNKRTYGWVFGGYLSNESKPFSTENWTDADLQRYLSRFAWSVGYRQYYYFAPDGKFTSGVYESETGSDGTYTTSVKDMTITVNTDSWDEESEGKLNNCVYKIISITEDSFTFKIENSKHEQEMYPAFVSYYFWPQFNLNKIQIDSFTQTAINYLFFDFSSERIKKLSEEEDFNENFYNNMMKLGIVIDWKENYLSTYNTYWNRPN